MNIRSPGTVGRNIHELPYRCWELNPGLPEEHPLHPPIAAAHAAGLSSSWVFWAALLLSPLSGIAVLLCYCLWNQDLAKPSHKKGSLQPRKQIRSLLPHVLTNKDWFSPTLSEREAAARMPTDQAEQQNDQQALRREVWGFEGKQITWRRHVERISNHCSEFKFNQLSSIAPG